MPTKNFTGLALRFIKDKVSQFNQAILGNLDLPGAITKSQTPAVDVCGWVAGKYPIQKIEILIDRQLIGEAEYGLTRPDVWQGRPWLWPLNCGFRLSWHPHQSGTYMLTVRVTDSRNNLKEFERKVTLTLASQETGKDFIYKDWIDANEPSEATLNEQKTLSSQLAYRPLISLIVPVYNPLPAVLQAMFDSVLAQTYPQWELCAVDGGSSREGLSELWQLYSTKDPRLKLVRLPENKGIVANSNFALGLASGEFIGLLDHDDCLSPDALFEVASLLNASPSTDLIYSDHDLLSEDGLTRHDPLFKPGWSPEILLSANYLTHFTVIRRKLVSEAGNFLDASEGAQDWDLFFRVTEKISPDKIRHIPKVLYHWRESPNSTATNIFQKPLAPINQQNAIEQHLARTGLSEARAFFDETGYWRVSWPVKTKPLVSIIVPTLEKPELLQACVSSILTRTGYRPFELIIVDTGSRSPDITQLYSTWSGLPEIKILHYREPFNYSAVNNWAAAQVRGEILVFLNNDTEVIASDWLEEIVRWLQRPEIGVVGAKLLKKDMTIQHAGVVVGLGGLAGHIFAGEAQGANTIFGRVEWYRNYLAVTAACLGVRKSVFDQLGGFDETFKLNGSDVDLGIRIVKKGLRVVYNPFVKLYHLESATHGGNNVPENDYRLSIERYREWYSQGDPFFNPNLSLLSTHPALKLPSEPDAIQLGQKYLVTAP